MNSDTLKYKIEIDMPTKFNLTQTLNCGQCFRFFEDGGRHCGVVLDKYLEITENDCKLVIYSDKEIYASKSIYLITNCNNQGY